MIVGITFITIALIIGVTVCVISHQGYKSEEQQREHEMTMQAMKDKHEIKTKAMNLEEYRLRSKAEYSEEYKKFMEIWGG